MFRVCYVQLKNTQVIYGFMVTCMKIEKNHNMHETGKSSPHFIYVSGNFLILVSYPITDTWYEGSAPANSPYSYIQHQHSGSYPHSIHVEQEMITCVFPLQYHLRNRPFGLASLVAPPAISLPVHMHYRCRQTLSTPWAPLLRTSPLPSYVHYLS